MTRRNPRVAEVFAQEDTASGPRDNLMTELQEDDEPAFRNFKRLAYSLRRSKPLCMRNPLEPGLCLVITFRYLTSGSFYQSLSYSFSAAQTPSAALYDYDSLRQSLRRPASRGSVVYKPRVAGEII